MRPAIAVVALLLSQCSPAFAGMLCVPRAALVEQLRDGHAEQPVAMGLDNSGVVVEVFAATGGKTWTIVVTRPNGLACLMAAGQGWETVPADSQAKGEGL